MRTPWMGWRNEALALRDSALDVLRNPLAWLMIGLLIVGIWRVI